MVTSRLIVPTGLIVVLPQNRQNFNQEKDKSAHCMRDPFRLFGKVLNSVPVLNPLLQLNAQLQQ